MDVGPQNKPVAPATPVNQPKLFFSNDGKRVTKGGETWRMAVEKAARGEEIDGCPIPVWFAERYNIPDVDMRDFITEVNAITG